MYKIALTGGIGTGKTYLSTHFIEMGIPVFYADDEAKKLYTDPQFLQTIREAFGDEVFVPNQSDQLSFERLAAKVFADEEALQQLNRLVHPAVMQKFEEWCAQQDAPAVMMESAVVFEGNLISYFDKIIVADAPVELRIRRIMARNPEMSREQILARMARQMPQEEKCRRADLVVCTGETYAEALGVR